ncbi:MAG: ATP-binding cassette domain-containing protein [Gammaproteobacteria bacterium]|nr:ATP-binding cassette domain-containing protein [Gammaproteobacteria bacterium]
MSALFEFEDVLVAGGDGAPILQIDHAVVQGEGITVIVGPSGAGKTTLLRLCNRLAVPDRGSIRFRGEDLSTMDTLALRRKVGMVFQQPVLFGGTGLDNLRVAEPSITEPEARALFRGVGLDESFLDEPVDDLSGGEAQRLCLARTLATGPEVLLMDEPTASLDPAATEHLEDLVRGLDGVPILWVTHDVAQVRRLADEVMVISDGQLVSDGASVQSFLNGGNHG